MISRTARTREASRLRKMLLVPVLGVALFAGALPAHASNTQSAASSDGKAGGNAVSPHGFSVRPAGGGSGHRVR
jgi:hypothetical protein